MADYTLQQLADEAGVTPRTIRYYIAQGLLASPGAGSGARYTDAHLERLRLIRQLQRNHLPLAEIRKQLTGQAAVDYIRSVMPPSPPVRTMASAVASTKAPDWLSRAMPSAPARLVGPPVRQPQPSQEPDRSQWDRVALSRTSNSTFAARSPVTRTAASIG